MIYIYIYIYIMFKNTVFSGNGILVDHLAVNLIKILK